jgi:hypothetical protein
VAIYLVGFIAMLLIFTISLIQSKEDKLTPYQVGMMLWYSMWWPLTTLYLLSDNISVGYFNAVKKRDSKKEYDNEDT